MDTLQGFFLALGWFVLRFGLPVLLTVGMCRLLKTLDARWQMEGQAYRNQTRMRSAAHLVHCWEVIGCREERRKSCPAYRHPEIPCWQHFRGAYGELRGSCIRCSVF